MNTQFRIIGTALLATALFVPPLAFAGSASTFDPQSVGATLEVLLRDDQTATVRGARVMSVTDDSFTAETIWGSNRLTWIVRVDERTSLSRKSGASISLTNITAGDYVSFSGDIITNLLPFTVRAVEVKDWTITDNYAVHTRTISQLDAHTRTFTLTTAKGSTLAVSTTESTTFAKFGAESFHDLVSGDQVLVFGPLDAAERSLAASKINIVERAAVEEEPLRVATGLGPWVDNLLPRFFEGRPE